MELSLTDISAMSAAPRSSPERTMELSLTDIAAMSKAAMTRSGAAAIEPETEADRGADRERADRGGRAAEDQVTPVGG